MASRVGQGEVQGSHPMHVLIAAFVGIIVIAAIMLLAPTIGQALSGAQATGAGQCFYVNGTTSIYGACGANNTTGPFQVYGTPVYGTYSRWNMSANTNIPAGDAIWSTNAIIGGVVVLVFFIVLAIYYIRRMT